jgi:hypothetical protein
MVFPVAVFIQIVFSQTFSLKPKALQQLAGAGIVGHVIGHYSVQRKFDKCVVDHFADDLFHQTLTFKSFCNGVTHVAGLKYSSNNICQGTETYHIGFCFVGCDEIGR